MNPENPLFIILQADLWRYGLFAVMSVCLISFITFQAKRIGWIAATFWGYILASALMTLEFPSTPFGFYTNAFIGSAGQTFAEALLIPLAVLSLPFSIFKRSWFVLEFLICLEIVSVWVIGHGVMIAPSFDTSLIAIFMPFMPGWLALISVITILAHHGSTAMMILIAQCVFFAFRSKNGKLCAALLIPLCIAAMVFHSHGPHLDGDQRLMAWKSFLEHWWNGTAFMGSDGGKDVIMLRFGGTWVSRMFGTGAGSFTWLSLMVEPHLAFLSAHSEPVQIVFELGLVGLGLAVATFVTAIKSAWDKPCLLAMIVGIVGCGLTYHPSRFAPTAILICFVLRDALENKSGLDESKPLP